MDAASFGCRFRLPRGNSRSQQSLKDRPRRESPYPFATHEVPQVTAGATDVLYMLEDGCDDHRRRSLTHPIPGLCPGTRTDSEHASDKLSGFDHVRPRSYPSARVVDDVGAGLQNRRQRVSLNAGRRSRRPDGPIDSFLGGHSDSRRFGF